MEHGTLSGGETRAGGAPGGGGPDFDFGATIRGFAGGQVVFGRYRLERMLGRGGMGVVWLAEDGKLGRPAALKFLPEIVQADAVALDDLKRETNRSLDLTHRNIVRIYDFLEGGGAAAISMEYIDGRTLSALRLERPGRCFDAGELRPWLGQLCKALDYAHAVAKVVHRDLKPANLMVDAGGALKVTDFGISSSLTESVSRISVGRAGSGTLVYMSPQQALGRRGAVTDDIYSLGATLYDLLTAKPPFYSGNIQHQIETVVPPSMRERRAELGIEGRWEIPEAWEAVVAACLDKDPSKRPSSAGEVWGRLGASGEGLEARGERFGVRASRTGSKVLGSGNWGAEHGKRKTGKRAGAVMAVGLVLAAIGAGGWWFGFETPRRELAAREVKVGGLIARGVAAIEAKDMKEGRSALAEAQKLAPGDARVVEGLAKLDAVEKEAARLAAARGGVEITTDPPGAEVTVGGVAKGPSPLRQGDLRLGKYPLTVALKGYEPIEREIEIGEGQFANPGVIRLIRSVGSLAVATEPGGQKYEVSLKEGEAGRSEMPAGVAPSGTTPATLEGLPTGIYAVKLSREGWPDYIDEARVERGKVGAVNWEFARGGLSATSEPPGAEVLSAGKSLGTTPLRVELPTGTHELLFRYKDWPEQKRSATVEKGKEAGVAVEYALGSIVVTSEPPGAEVYSGTTKLGVTPLKIGDLKPGVVKYGLKLKGWKSGEASGVVEAKKEVPVLGRMEAYPRPREGEPFENSIGMKFAPVPGTGVLFSVYETRIEDFQEFVRETGFTQTGGAKVLKGKRTRGRYEVSWELDKGASWAKPGFPQGPDHPVVCVSWEDAKAFCRWLSEKEGNEYRLPNDAEWSAAVGSTEYPWGNRWPPQNDAGNYLDRQGVRDRPGAEEGFNWVTVPGLDDGAEKTAPVGRYAANRLGLYDMGGNAREWCEDWYKAGMNSAEAKREDSDLADDGGGQKYRVVRGASWYTVAKLYLESRYRGNSLPSDRSGFGGFRCVVVAEARR